jgi:hypothetical protein
MKNLGLPLTARAQIGTRIVLMRRVLAFFLLLAGAIQFMECSAEFLVQSQESRSAVHAATEGATTCSVPTSGAPTDMGSDHGCHLLCASHCSSHHTIEIANISLFRDAPSRVLIFHQLQQVFLPLQSFVFEPPRA